MTPFSKWTKEYINGKPAKIIKVNLLSVENINRDTE